MAAQLNRLFAQRLAITTTARTLLPPITAAHASSRVALPLAAPAISSSSSFATAAATQTQTPAQKKRAAAAAAREKERAQKAKERERARAAKLKEKEKVKAAKEKERAKARLAKEQAKEAKKLKPWELLDADGKKVPLPTETRPRIQSAWIHFLLQRLPTLKSELEAADPSQVPIGAPAVARRAADEWRSMSDSAKEPYTSAAARQIAERPAKLAEWEASLTAQDRARIAAYNRHLGKVGGKNQIKITRDPKRPVKPATAFMRFLSAKREEYDQEGVGRGVPQARKAGEEWNRLGEEAKKTYEAAYQAEMPAYKAALDEYLRSTTVAA
ncbi:hypothetical protein BDZ90DRAFT_234099 [Jaminaea rosea]|uniref:HMG box domain-containing protein n=1 Tax=Jaminaea rosea TaxID=1569628 RepID=A0A316UKB1_9BASI|nr:hypothetical protein BDZ90DRAFT_234099 [Jaminaea rosea]PWN25669.1 hypothetical protein BDZ90DRAFT_234099 [Jaminaea rosea]